MSKRRRSLFKGGSPSQRTNTKRDAQFVKMTHSGFTFKAKSDSLPVEETTQGRVKRVKVADSSESKQPATTRSTKSSRSATTSSSSSKKSSTSNFPDYPEVKYTAMKIDPSTPTPQALLQYFQNSVAEEMKGVNKTFVDEAKPVAAVLAQVAENFLERVEKEFLAKLADQQIEQTGSGAVSNPENIRLRLAKQELAAMALSIDKESAEWQKIKTEAKETPSKLRDVTQDSSASSSDPQSGLPAEWQRFLDATGAVQQRSHLVTRTLNETHHFLALQVEAVLSALRKVEGRLALARATRQQLSATLTQSTVRGLPGASDARALVGNLIQQAQQAQEEGKQ